MSDPREEQRAWLRAVLAQTGLSPTALAQKSRLSQPTITRFLNDESVAHALSARTVSAVEKATGLRFGPDPRPAGFAESEAAPYNPRKPDGDFAFDPMTFTGKNGIDPWRLASRALETVGYLPGDVLIVDLNADPKPGDVVCAQLYDWARSKAETVFRVYEPPYLMPATNDPSLHRPYVVDNNTVLIKGVVITSLRPRRARAA